MSLWFILKDKNKKANVTIKEILELNQGLEQYSIGSNNPQYSNIMNSVLGEFICIYFGKKGKCARGFEASWNAQDMTLEVRINTICSIEDWKSAIEFLVNMGKHIHVNEVEDENGNIYTLEELENYPIIETIEQGVKVTYSAFNGESLMVFGVNRDVHLSKDMLKEYIDSGNCAEKLSKQLTDCQYINAFSANQKLYRNERGIVGNYTITQENRTIIPYAPVVDFHNIEAVGEEKVQQWFISFIYIDGREDDPESYKVLGRMDYGTFIKHLPKEKYSFIDYKCIVVEELTKREMEEFLSKDGN